ncbi:hypothetical protein Plhal710r2_c075g0179071 [Plasmopara halstedii]
MFREVNMATGITSATWRVYFLPKSCPPQLVVNGSAVEEIKKSDAKLHGGAQHSKSPAADNHLALIPRTPDDTLSISTFSGSNGNLSPPGSPEITSATPPMLLLMYDGTADGFTAVSNKKKRSRKDIDFTALLTSLDQQPLNRIATSDYFQSLQSMEVEFELKDITTDKKHGDCKQIVPVNVMRPKWVETSTESAFFIEKHHSKIVKAAKATSIIEVTESMLNDENTALLDTLPDRLLAAEAKVGGIVNIIESATNPDNIVKKLVESPLAFNSALSLKMAIQDNDNDEFAQSHVINRVLCATNAGDDTTFANKWKKTMGSAVPSKRADIFKACSAWWTHSDAITDLSRASNALGMFEMAVIATAPMLFENDHWIQYFTGRLVE